MALELITPMGVAPEADPAFDALRVTQRPPEAVGAFRLGKFSGLTAGLAANGPLFFLRNPDPTKIMILQYLKIRAAVITGFTAAQEIAFDAIQARTWTVATGGGTAVLVNNNNLKKRSSLAPSIADARIATTSVLNAPTATLDNESFMVGMGKTLAAAATVQEIAIEAEFDATNGSDYPIILSQNEGIIVRNAIAMGAGGTVRWGITAAWLEANSY
jgi:hypothetical protein